MKPKTFNRGIHIPEHKDVTPGTHIITADLPMQVTLTLKQHIGAQAIPLVKRGDHVHRYQKVAEASGVVSAPIHTPISGTVERVDSSLGATGFYSDAIYIKATAQDHAEDSAMRVAPPQIHDYSEMTPNEIIATIADAGIVGLGGATFPTAVKLSPPPPAKADMLIINAAECEPYLTCDDALMRTHAPEIVEGIDILMRAAKVERACIGIEVNKPEAKEALQRAIDSNPARQRKIEIVPLATKYPQGGEKQLIYAITRRSVPSGGLPISVGVIVQNVGTAFAVYNAIALHRPLVERVVTIWKQGNFMVPIGMKISDLMPADDIPYDIADVIIGGPMMGRSAVTLDAPIEKGVSGVTVITPPAFDPQPCIRCAACVEACPMGLEPYLIASYSRHGMMDAAREAGAKDCIECGCCVYSCPSCRPILDYIKTAKKRK